MGSIKNNDLYKICTGCTACQHTCPLGCISMEENPEGFLYPVVDESICISCGICTESCHVLSDAKNNDVLNCYAAVCKNTNLRNDSSSGGAFITIAYYFIEQKKGFVCGAVMTDEFEVKHLLTEDIFEVRKMQGSKYVQSDLRVFFQKFVRVLRKVVMFSFQELHVRLRD